MPFGWVAAGSALLGAVGSMNAADTQASAANNATAMQQGMFNQTQQNLQPYMQGGSTALSSILDKLKNGQLGGGFTPADFLSNKDPGYDFQLKQGQQALMNSQAATNGSLSGAALKSLIDYNQGQASTGYQNAYNRWLATQNNTFNQLSSLASLGENAGANVGNTGATYANGMANTITGAANANAAGTIGAVNAISGGLNNYNAYRYLNGGYGGGYGGGGGGVGLGDPQDFVGPS